MDSGIKDYRLNSYLLIEDERDRQNQKWGTETNMIGANGPHEYLLIKMVVLMEEVGELAKEILEGNRIPAQVEAVQVAAVAKAIVEGLLEINGS